MTLTADSPEIRDFIAAYEENINLGHFGKNQKVIAEDRRKYIAIDEVDRDATPPYHYPNVSHRGGRFLIDREDGTVYSIEGYGKRGYRLGEAGAMTARYREATRTFNPDSRVMVEHGHAGVRTTPKAPARPGLTVLQGGLQRRRGWAIAKRSVRARYRNR